MTLSSMLCGPALTLIRTALIIWFWAPADWLTLSTPLPLLKEVPWIAAVASMARSAAAPLIFCVTAMFAWALWPTAIATLLLSCCWSPAAWLSVTTPLYCLAELSIVALLLLSAIAAVQLSTARSIQEAFISSLLRSCRRDCSAGRGCWIPRRRHRRRYGRLHCRRPGRCRRHWYWSNRPGRHWA